MTTPDDTPSKRCKDCGEIKPLDDFYASPQGRLGRQAYCKPCHKARSKRWATENRERQHAIAKRSNDKHRDRVRARDRAYKDSHVESLREKSAAYRVKNRAARIEYDRERRARDPEKTRADYRKWREAHPDRVRERNRKHQKAHPEMWAEYSARRRARQKSAPEVERINRGAIYTRDRGICHICGQHVPRKEMTLDHLIPLSKGGPHTAKNLAVAHLSCNSKRGAGRLPAQLRLLG